MSIVALITWITAAAGGLYLVSIWLIEYDREFQQAAATRLPPAVLVSHVTLAGGGLIIWAGYLVFDNDSLIWVAVLALVLAATLGSFMAFRWISVYRQARELRRTYGQAQADWPAASAAPAAHPQAGRRLAVAGAHRVDVRTRPVDIGPPERNFPLPVVIGHGLFAVTTLTLVLLIAFGVGGS